MWFHGVIIDKYSWHFTTSLWKIKWLCECNLWLPTSKFMLSYVTFWVAWVDPKIGKKQTWKRSEAPKSCTSNKPESKFHWTDGTWWVRPQEKGERSMGWLEGFRTEALWCAAPQEGSELDSFQKNGQRDGGPGRVVFSLWALGHGFPKWMAFKKWSGKRWKTWPFGSKGFFSPTLLHGQVYVGNLTVPLSPHEEDAHETPHIDLMVMMTIHDSVKDVSQPISAFWKVIQKLESRLLMFGMNIIIQKRSFFGFLLGSP